MTLSDGKAWDLYEMVCLQQQVSAEELSHAEEVSRLRENSGGIRFFVLLNLGLILTAAGIMLFKAPNHFALGGTSGLSIILSTLFPSLPISAFMWIVNAVLVILGLVFLDRHVIGWTIFSSFALSAYVTLFEWLIPLSGPLTNDTLLELCFAVLLPAIGSAIVFNAGASTGGTDILAMKEKNVEKAGLLYDYLDSSDMFSSTVDPSCRSLMNVPFVTGNPDLDAEFVAAATKAGFVSLKGHRTVGGMRASIYNAMPREGVVKLVAFMKDFETNH